MIEKVLKSENLPESFSKKEYGMHSIIVQNAAILRNQLKAGKQMPFQKLISLNVGNPQNVGQPPIKFTRQVMACVIDTGLLENPKIHIDIKNRAKQYLKAIKSFDSYNEGQGIELIRKNVAKYIEKRDEGIKCDMNNIFLINGAADGVQLIINQLINTKNDGIIIPVPRFPLYEGAIQLNTGNIVTYFLDEEKKWQLSIDELKKQYNEAKQKGIIVKALVVINPGFIFINQLKKGNPTGAVLDESNIKEIINFCFERSILIIADEVYQENIYSDIKKFNSFKKVLMNMDEQYKNNQEIISFHSISKGISGECGLRGGFMELINIEQTAIEYISKLQELNIFPNVIGQLGVDLMINPPSLENGCSIETVKEYQSQRNELLSSFKIRSQIVTKYLRQCKNITANEIEGAMYSFPKIQFSEKVIQEAQAQNMMPDEYFCNCCLNETGIILVPGSSFGQLEGTYHFRITILLFNTQELEETMKKFQQFNENFHNRFQ